jgi:hypothetical protein
MIAPLDATELRRSIQSAAPFAYCLIDNFLDPEFARHVHAAFPGFEEARKIGRSFRTVNERGKIQITDTARFAPPVLELHRMLSAPSWTQTLSHAFEIPNLLADEELIGGGIHQTGPRGRLDVHVDFNYIAERGLHRRLNILIFFNPDWRPEWGGALELWDREVKVCCQSFLPLFNRCVIFETSEISYHGVAAVQCPANRSRQSFAAYYYTTEPPPHWTGESHGTVFRSRPGEAIRGRVLMPAERAAAAIRRTVRDVRRGVKRLLKPPPGR